MASPGTALDRMREVTCGTEVWIATALLTRENPERADFQVEEILRRVAAENIQGEVRPGIEVHIRNHCCANKAPNPSTLRILYATGRNTRRLYRLTDDSHSGRTGRTMPEKSEMPGKYHELVDWWLEQNSGITARPGKPHKTFLDMMLELRAASKGVWSDEQPDEYVRKLREDWD